MLKKSRLKKSRRIKMQKERQYFVTFNDLFVMAKNEQEAGEEAMRQLKEGFVKVSSIELDDEYNMVSK